MALSTFATYLYYWVVILVDESEQYSTLSGYILFHLGRLPENGEKLLSDGYIFEIVTMDGHKIEKVHLIQQESSSAS